MTDQSRGHLVIIGGAEDKDGDCEILQRFFTLAGERKAVLAVMSTASTSPEAGEQYRKIFTDFGAAEVKSLAVQSRDEANHPEHRNTFKDCTGIFFTGGDQLRITGILGGSVLGSALHRAYSTGTVVAGTSAGASVMSETMLVGGLDDATPAKEIIRMAPGLGMLENVVVDQHFAQRGRIGRLLAAVAHNPYILGVGIDEDTAIVVNNADECEVIGSGTVTIVDGRSVTHSNVSESSLNQPLTLTDVKLHILSRSYGFHLKKRQIKRPATKEDHS
ncbi:MAG: cyanophycinase [Bacillota bacterium]|nr:cyanophycinase [Bacillota bacterium]MDW7683040.1 cyanophycinase [Bacillota bacterium]